MTLPAPGGRVSRFFACAASLSCLLLAPGAAASDAPGASPLKFAVSFPKAASASPLDGRILLVVSTDGSDEPRKQVGLGLDTQQIFGIDVDALPPGKEAILDATVLGYPLESLARIPKGTYWVQAVLHRYETFHRADGHTVKLPMDRGEGQHWNLAPGNLFSTPKQVEIDPSRPGTISIRLDQVIPPISDPPATKFVRHEKIRSERLSKF